MLSWTYLSKGDLESLRDQANYPAPPAAKIIYWPGQGKRPKRVQVSAPADEGIDQIRDKLKREIYLRGCNAGVFYRVYEKGDRVVAEAVPAIITSE
jgi:hypothetical protein